MNKKIIALKNVYTGKIITVNENEGAFGNQDENLGHVTSIEFLFNENAYEIISKTLPFRQKPLNKNNEKGVRLELVTHLDRNNYDPIYLVNEIIEPD